MEQVLPGRSSRWPWVAAAVVVMLATGRGSPPGSWSRAVRSSRFTAGEDRRDAADRAAEEVGQLLTSADATEALAGVGFRGVDGKPLEGGVGRVSTLSVDPERPVRIIGIGVSGDADADALSAIAEATGGQSYVARRPQDIGTVFQRAISVRE